MAKREYGPSEGHQKMRSLIEQANEMQREALMKKLPLDHTLRYLYAHKILPTVENYLRLNYLGDVRTLDDLAELPEDYADVINLIENGYLVDTKSQKVN